MKIRTVCLTMLTAVVLASDCGALVYTLPNASFESPDFADGLGVVYTAPGLVNGWNWTGPSLHGQFGIVDPNDSRFLGTTGNGASRLPSPADGYQYALLGGSARSVNSIQNPVPVATIQPFTLYTLNLAAINEYAQNSGSHYGTLQLSLLAGPNVVAGSTIDYSSFGFGEIRLLETSFATGDLEDPFVGQDLNIRVTYTADSRYGSNGYFDNLVLTAMPVPEPTSFALLLLASILSLQVCHAQRRK